MDASIDPWIGRSLDRWVNGSVNPGSVDRWIGRSRDL